MIRFRAKCTPWTASGGLPIIDPSPVYGDFMTPETFAAWATYENDRERASFGSVSHLRQLAPIGDDGKELTGMAAAKATLDLWAAHEKAACAR